MTMDLYMAQMRAMSNRRGKSMSMTNQELAEVIAAADGFRKTSAGSAQVAWEAHLNALLEIQRSRAGMGVAEPEAAAVGMEMPRFRVVKRGELHCVYWGTGADGCIWEGGSSVVAERLAQQLTDRLFRLEEAGLCKLEKPGA